MPDITVNVELYCTCGNGICNNARVKSDRRRDYLVIDPCEKCIEAARETGFEEGRKKAEEAEK